ncbi:myo-inositol-1(or 4)-monophosphatase [Sphaeroforma arctica JP610]|uniref:Inositol-1-monophosphatase n=1 Tax=Sphaeroforma arctica JP610 TaxID=667725 RepID=A0A0L0FT85_9EUKA|nr:myo-inositol-1(or 4)-monophosphatase, variant [Sphaeroforma arctica JP610]XP_014153684.1 myo-inositol-1(or 4)-monophosphatase [Sphaeroforma arctica JP610]KNC79781.1 myo-inositol-1(or 4)-monophosphatase, variant [Sphaeroforma arctica JP610]KNC79782.1 myo-inositol-1(or 4)-monophosphatase [Sphaeroforma arctica JP610]|eukprot:XP_014153683.1 myo-inositol-1(or 4)-monophosphatase, variant [Sphaeroforma arctica JP610]
MTDLNEMQKYLSTAETVSRDAGKLINDAFQNHSKNVMTKDSSVDLVTVTDQQCEDLIKKTLLETYPDHKFIGEESTAAGAKNELTDLPTWIVDPLDGTTNFVHGFPYVSVCIGLTIKKKVVLGVVYAPILDEMYTAIRGQGATLNGTSLSVSKCTGLKNALVCTEIGSNRESPHIDIVRDNYYRMAVAPCHSVRSLGAAAMNMCMVAKGACDAYYEFGIHAWDYCAASIIVEEAGGYCCDTTGTELDLMARKIACGATPALMKEITDTLTDITMPRD